ncbi:uncharacterized protein SPPG_02616 [Spizellomyces punctatus DAOM BR117]|uniref:Uncharacterized protein n=1 Tax=Spizellomyces punctatus (strain DAOM BR117) TaxID=645134 RepID=A0A0L0HLZ8_SPIPD|nr:uncharacterized protein SPPG_02616 [Spizellomyces punctatus DAOM BR117]KND02122.1 hypothetical protein SPPG_02616 [Spizellomyces punctatus DAOM BR117]|eukprot:XP_016610161.1 hypothetical protein SPPG_02616 [Spizellomyces punctatus DAOM BR117]
MLTAARAIVRSHNSLLCRSFYTWNIPTDTPRVVLDDGSTLIHRHAAPVKPSSEKDLPPRLRTYPKRSWLTQQQIEEARTLRQEDPDTWTVQELARKYNSYPGFIMRIAPCPKDRKDMLKKQAETEFENLPLGKKKTRIDRIRRKALW